MLKSVRFINWKSFADATLHLDPLTVLIGANASGKSNAIEGLQLLSRLASGMDIQTALNGGDKSASLRGGSEWAGFRGAEAVTIDTLTQDPESKKDRLYRTSIKLKPDLSADPFQARLPNGEPDPAIESVAMLLAKAALSSGVFFGVGAAFTAGVAHALAKHMFSAVRTPGIHPHLVSSLGSLLVLTPATEKMRRYVPLADALAPDAWNLAGVIAALPEPQRKALEDTLTQHLAKLPEYRVRRIYVERFGLHQSDAMLCCEEPWGSKIDARCMSDGTLRFIAILTALLTLPTGSLLVIEDVDTGIHPSRLGLVFEVLRSEGKRRGIDVLVTTHNEAFLDALPPEMWPFVTVAHRDAETGASHLTPLDELGEYGRIVAAGPLGRAVTRGVVERAAQAEPRPPTPGEAVSTAPVPGDNN